ncbi:MAG: outer membrane protein assembly factor BamC [Gammaproteobacteria bacterium]
MKRLLSLRKDARQNYRFYCAFLYYGDCFNGRAFPDFNHFTKIKFMLMTARNTGWIVLYVSALLSCTNTGNKYRNTEKLEQPPEIEINAAASSEHASVSPATTTESIKQGLDEQVHLDKAPGAWVMVINKPFEQAWFILGVLLNQLKIEVTDRNRDEGYYYVKYDPDVDYSKKQGFLDGMMSMFSADDYAERTYSLKLLESYGETEVTASIVPESEDKAKAQGESDEQKDDSKDGPERLLQTLFQTLREGMEAQSRKKRRE